MRRLYRWVIHWSDTPYAVPALFILAFSESSFFPIPPDVLLMAMDLAQPRRGFIYAAVCSAGSVLGGMFGYALGYLLKDAVKGFCVAYVPGFTENVWNLVVQKYNENAFLAVFTAAFTPIPYKVFTIAGGFCEIPFLTLVVASLIGRPARFFAVSTLFYFCGAWAQQFIDRYFNLLTILFTVLLIGGFVLLKMI
ncbi:MAG: DedA family protein [Planctomycetes bacterium]|nr:DedA family protein [Planctomycetota bacterium]